MNQYPGPDDDDKLTSAEQEQLIKASLHNTVPFPSPFFPVPHPLPPRSKKKLWLIPVAALIIVLVSAALLTGLAVFKHSPCSTACSPTPTPFTCAGSSADPVSLN